MSKSSPQLDSADVAILGGGLAGLTLGLQLRQALPQARIVILERQHHPVPAAAHKVGESTVEIGAHYLAEVLGLKDHLQQQQLRKYGLRFFFGAGDVDDLAEATELGASHLLTVPSYQLDRGILENHLAERAASEGIEFVDGATVTGVQLAAEPDQRHGVRYHRAGSDGSLSADWIVDAMSRASVLKRQLRLAEDNRHGCGAVWFRLADRVDIGTWSDSDPWKQACTELPRWLSTNHLMGPGYWVWLIPLSSGATSVGIVFDHSLHDFDALKTHAGSMAWLARHQPLCHRALEACDGQLLDFRSLRNFSHGCQHVFSAQRWALTGEAGVFLDPFYSPGSDFIAISNTYITDLVRRDLGGDSIARLARQYESFYLSFYRSSLLLYRDQYPLFGHARAMVYKSVWDYAYYWGILALLFFSNRMTDTAFLGRHAGLLQDLQRLNEQAQRMFRAWSLAEPEAAPAGVFVNQSAMPLLVRLNRELTDMPPETTDMDRRIQANARMLHRLAFRMQQRAPRAAAGDWQAAPGDDDEDLLAGIPVEVA